MLFTPLISFFELQYKIDKQTLKTQKLNVSVWHRDTFKRNSFLGEVELDLETWDWDNKQNKQLKWYPLKRKVSSELFVWFGGLGPGIQERAAVRSHFHSECLSIVWDRHVFSLCLINLLGSFPCCVVFLPLPILWAG